MRAERSTWAPNCHSRVIAPSQRGDGGGCSVQNGVVPGVQWKSAPS